VNTECNCAGTADLTLYQSAYSEAGGANRVSNPAFAQGLTDWGTWGTANISLSPSDRGGTALNVTATPSQQAGLNSNEFAVTAGQAFQVSFDARVAPLSSGSGYLAVFFLDSNNVELARESLPFAAASIPLGTATTDQNGGVTGSLAPLQGATFSIQEMYPGDKRWFPAYASTTIARP
jgi:hypothetical protein